jgi:predicted nucleotidyltransferase component of viral defense system
MARPVTNVAASVRARLTDLHRSSGQPLDLLLTRYAHERLLYRLSRSADADRFALKGAMLFTTWFDDPHRPTRDLDLLAFGDPEPEPMLDLFRRVCATEFDDGVTFDAERLVVLRNREDLRYGGLRLQTDATISGARVRIVVDIGFGDAVEPGLERCALPVLLDQPPPVLRAYARETVIAEKFQAMVRLGEANTRLKDFYDIWMLAQSGAVDHDRLARTLRATFARRDTPLPEAIPVGLSAQFSDNAAKRAQWAALLDDVDARPGDLADVARAIAAFIMPAVAAARGTTA